MPVKKKRSKRTYKKKYNVLKKKARTYKRSYKRARGNSWGDIGRSALKYGLPLLKGIKTISGYGDYHGSVSGGQIPKIQNTSSGCIIRHREYIGDLPSSVGFVSQQYYINPGNAYLFPWLNVVANQFEEWVPRGMIFQYKSTSSDTVVNVTSGSPALGTVIMATDYNIYNPPFGNKQQMENYEFASSCKPSCDMIHTIENRRSSLPIDPYFVTSSTVLNGLPGDGRLYYPGLFQIATYGNTVNPNTFVLNNLGELWVSYEIEFKKPRILPGAALNAIVPMDHFEIMDTTATGYTPFGTSTTNLHQPTTYSSLGGLISGGIVPNTSQLPPLIVYNSYGQVINSIANTYYFPSSVSTGLYMFQYNARFATQGVIGNTMSIQAVNCTPFSLENNNTSALFINNATLTSCVSFTYFVTVTSRLAYISFSVNTPSGQPASIVSGDFYVLQMPNTID